MRLAPDGCGDEAGSAGLIGGGTAEGCCLIYLIRSAQPKCRSAGSHHAAAAICIGREKGGAHRQGEAGSFLLPGSVVSPPTGGVKEMAVSHSALFSPGFLPSLPAEGG